MSTGGSSLAFILQAPAAGLTAPIGDEGLLHAIPPGLGPGRSRPLRFRQSTGQGQQGGALLPGPPLRLAAFAELHGR